MALTPGTPESVGMSSQRLARIRPAIQARIDAGILPGAVVAIARQGRLIHHEAIGSLGPDTSEPMPKDALFAIASMTKPICAVAAMILWEEGLFELKDFVYRFIPSFREMRVVSRSAEFTPARRPITIRDLLTHRSGLTYGFLDNGPVGDAYRTNGVSDGLGLTEGDLAQNIERLARIGNAVESVMLAESQAQAESEAAQAQAHRRTRTLSR